MTIQSRPLLNFSNEAVKSALGKFIKEERGIGYFAEYEIKSFLKGLGFNIPKGVLLGKGSTDLKPSLRYPLTAKISAPKISSKSDVGGVILDIKNQVQLKTAIEKLSTIDSCEGILVEEMAPKGVEVIIGGIKDNQFGPVVMFGMGGLYVELYKDIAFALAPADEKDALWLIKQIKGYKLLEGYRNSPPPDIPYLIDMIVAVSKIIASGMLVEIDLNPVVLYHKGALVLDAKMFI
jgi:acetyl-CoA synthetase (ADP-forming)